MKNRLSLPFLFLILNFTFTCTTAQQLEWVYTIGNTYKMILDRPMVDFTDGSIYQTAREADSHRMKENWKHYVLKLDPDGRFNSITYINTCQWNSMTVPVGKDQILSSLNMCDDRKIAGQKTIIYNLQGEPKHYGPVTLSEEFSIYPANDGSRVIFSKPLSGFVFNHIRAISVSPDLQFSNDSISLSAIAMDTMGVSPFRLNPVKMDNGLWIIPLIYGPSGSSKMTFSPRYGMVIAVQGEKIVWKYPETIIPNKLETVATDGKLTALVYTAHRPNKLIIVIDQNGNEKYRFHAKIDHTVEDLIMEDGKLLFLTHFGLKAFTIKGKLLQDDCIPSAWGLTGFERLVKYGDQTYLVMATQDNVNVIAKFFMPLGKIRKWIEPTPLESAFDVNSIHVDFMVRELMSLQMVFHREDATFDLQFNPRKENTVEANYEIELKDSTGETFNSTFMSNRIRFDIASLSKGNCSFVIRYPNGNHMIAGWFNIF